MLRQIIFTASLFSIAILPSTAPCSFAQTTVLQNLGEVKDKYNQTLSVSRSKFVFINAEPRGGGVASSITLERKQVRKLILLIKEAERKRPTFQDGQTASWGPISDGINSTISLLLSKGNLSLVVTEGRLNRFIYIDETTYQPILELLELAANH